MQEIITEIALAVGAGVAAYFVGIFKDRQYNLKIEDLYSKYKLLFNVSGALIKTLDEKLYVEMEQAITKMQTAYTSEGFTTKSFNQIVKECADVFNRAEELLKNRS